MSSAFVPADILKQMFGCLFNTEIRLSWLWWGLSLAFAACLGYCASRRGFRACGCAFLPSKRNDACRRAQEKAPEPRGWWEHPGSAPSCCFAGKEEEKMWGFLRHGIISAAGSLVAFAGCPRRETGGKGTAFVASLSYPCLHGTRGFPPPKQEEGRAALGEPWAVLSSS